MSEALAFVYQEGREVKLLESVDEVDGDDIKLINIFG